LKSISILWILTLLALPLGGCQSGGVASDVALSIDGELIRYAAFEEYLRNNLDRQEWNLDNLTLGVLFDQFLDAQLLVRLAVERGLSAPDAGERLAVDRLLREAERKVEPTDLIRYYQENAAEFVRAERVRLRLISVDERKKAEDALAALRSGDDFNQVAARFSQDPRAHLGGDQGLMGRDDLPPKFAEVVFALAPGEVSEIVQTEYGFQIFRVDERLPASTLSFEAARPLILEQVSRRAADATLAELLAEARKRYKIKIYHQNFPFDYKGAYLHAKK
jgi:PPIC-type PPIASE domain